MATSKKQTGAEIVADFMTKTPLTSWDRQKRVAVQYAVMFGTDKPTKAQAERMVAAYGR